MGWLILGLLVFFRRTFAACRARLARCAGFTTGRLRPAAAARLGVRLFLTPGRHPIKYPGAPDFPARARREDLAMPWGRVRVYHWSAAAADAPQVLVAHGWSDSVANLMPLIRRLLEDREVLETLTAFLQGGGVEDRPLPAPAAGTGRSGFSGSSARRA